MQFPTIIIAKIQDYMTIFGISKNTACTWRKADRKVLGRRVTLNDLVCLYGVQLPISTN